MLQKCNKKAALFTLTKKQLSCLVIAMCWVRVETPNLRAKDNVLSHQRTCLRG